MARPKTPRGSVVCRPSPTSRVLSSGVLTSRVLSSGVLSSGVLSWQVLGLGAVGLWALAGCAPPGGGHAGGGLRCAASAECRPGESCLDGRCEPSGWPADGGTVSAPDAGPAGSEDAGRPAPTGDGEVCGNGLDDDGDREVDEQCVCDIGATQACYGGPAAAAGVGVCARGAQACTSSGEFGSWTFCEGWTPPAEEVCNGLDDDCDGTADEGCECLVGERRPCYTGPAGTEGVGLCAAGSQPCTAGGWGTCEGPALPGVERCDGVDDDCDGSVDEGCRCRPGETRSCYETPSGMPGAGTPGVGVCRAGVAACGELPGGGSDFGACMGAATAGPEICHNGLDDDCDGSVDEGCTTPTVDCTTADVLFLVDTTGSMGGEIAQIQARLRDTIIPGLAAEISDIRFSVARFDDFPRRGYGGGADVPFQMVQPITASVPATQAAVNTLRAGGGADGPESQVEALYQAATGAGIAPFVPAGGCGAAGGYPCFRPTAAHIILLFTDADFHNGPTGAHGYSGFSPRPHSYAEAVAALGGVGAKVLGLMSGAAARDSLTAIARDTGALSSSGAPIVFDIGSDGRRLGAEVVRAIQTLCR